MAQIQTKTVSEVLKIKLGSGELDLSKLTVIIGPNLSGKSAILKCIYSSVSAPASEKFNLGSYIVSC